MFNFNPPPFSAPPSSMASVLPYLQPQMAPCPRKHFLQVASAKHAALKPQNFPWSRRLSATLNNSRRDAYHSAKGTIKKADIKDLKDRLQMKSKWDRFPVVTKLANTLPGPWRARIVPTVTRMELFWTGYDEDHMAVDLTPLLAVRPTAAASTFTSTSTFASAPLSVPTSSASLSTSLSPDVPGKKDNVVFESVIHSRHAPWRLENGGTGIIDNSLQASGGSFKVSSSVSLLGVDDVSNAPSGSPLSGKGKGVDRTLMGKTNEEAHSVLPSVSPSTSSTLALFSTSLPSPSLSSSSLGPAASRLIPALASSPEAFGLAVRSKSSPGPTIKELEMKLGKPYDVVKPSTITIPLIDSTPSQTTVATIAVSATHSSFSSPASPATSTFSTPSPSSTSSPTSSLSSSLSSLFSLSSSSSSLATSMSSSPLSSRLAVEDPVDTPLDREQASLLVPLPTDSPLPARPLTTLPDRSSPTSQDSSVSIQNAPDTHVTHSSVSFGISGGLSNEATEHCAPLVHQRRPSVPSGTSGESSDVTKFVGTSAIAKSDENELSGGYPIRGGEAGRSSSVGQQVVSESQHAEGSRGQEDVEMKDSTSSTFLHLDDTGSMKYPLPTYLREWAKGKKGIVSEHWSPNRSPAIFGRVASPRSPFRHSAFGPGPAEELAASAKFQFAIQQRNHSGGCSSGSRARGDERAGRKEGVVLKPDMEDTEIPRMRCLPAPKKRRWGIVTEVDYDDEEEKFKGRKESRIVAALRAVLWYPLQCTRSLLRRT
ncbi:hypothetical protein BDQ17DRAFT_1546250 [Cyathus striatus]|nr:hypothetical protein BDQ17DRAFT_1546250 [Cyathus striatus]